MFTIASLRGTTTPVNRTAEEKQAFTALTTRADTLAVCAPLGAHHNAAPLTAVTRMAFATATFRVPRGPGLSDAIAGELVGDGRLDGFCVIDIALAGGAVAAADLGDAAAIERRRMLGIDLQRGVVIEDRLFELAAFQVGDAAAVERVHVAGSDPQRLVAILQRGLEFADNRAHPAAVVERSGMPRIAANHLVEVLDGLGIVAVDRVALAAPVEARHVIRF